MKKFSFGASAFAAFALLMGSGAQAQVPATAKCSAAKQKCIINRTAGLLGCHNKAEGKGVAVDPACTDKVNLKYSDPIGGKGCMQKAEAKPPCATTGDAAPLAAKMDAFVDDVVTDVDPMYPTPVLDKCGAAKKKCIANKVKALLGCYRKDTLKPDPTKFGPCVTKAEDKFDGGAVPTKGCFAKNEAKYSLASATPCQTFGDTAAIEAKVDAFVPDVADDVAPPPASPTTMTFTTGTPGGSCGTAKDGSSVDVKTLTCGGLNIGGGGSIVAEGPTPDGSTSLYNLSCAGSSCTVSANSTAPAPQSTDPDCTDTGCNFGTPLPIPNPAIPSLTTCVLNTFNSPSSGTLDLSTGASSVNVDLSSDIYLTGNLAQPCPVCSGGTCDRGPRAGLACVSASSFGVTRDCPTGGADGTHPCTPGGGACLDGSHVGAINVNLSPLTTGSASDTDAGGIFCPGQTSAGCFGQASCRTITENGSPTGALTVGVPANGTLASVFCIAATGNGLVDASAALPGPGAVSLPGSVEVN